MDYHNIFQAQNKFYHSLATRDLFFRINQLSKLGKILKSNEGLLFEAIRLDFGKSSFDTYVNELALIYSEIHYCKKNLPRLAKPERVRTNLVNHPATSRIIYEPLGTTLVIGAWNYPYQLALLPVIASMAAGNTCIIKPSELPANTMAAMADLINNHFPPEYLHVIQGGIPETTEVLKLPFDKIFFTGSPRVGKIVYEAAAKNLTPVTLELGGKSPAIVTKKADLKMAAKRIVWGKFLNAGQTCIAPDYLLVDESVKDTLLTHVIDRLESADYAEGASHYVNIINQPNYDRLIRLMESSEIIYGGNRNKKTRYIQPAILNNVSWEDAVMQEEIFGPLLPVLTFRTFNEAIQSIRQREKPLAAYLFTNCAKEKKHFTEMLSFGGGCINDTIMHITNPNLPFGGVGHSGMGRYHGKYGFLTFSHQKSIVDRCVNMEASLRYPPYTERKLALIKKVF